jgi:hypothetical protein
MEFKGNYETARRLKSTIGQVCRYAVATSRAEFDPTPVLRGAITPPKVTPRAAITDPEKFGGLLRAIDGFDGQLSRDRPAKAVSSFSPAQATEAVSQVSSGLRRPALFRRLIPRHRRPIASRSTPRVIRTTCSASSIS